MFSFKQFLILLSRGATFHLCNKLPNTRVSAPHPGGYSYKFSHYCHCTPSPINIAIVPVFFCFRICSGPHPGGYLYKFSHSCHCTRINIAACCRILRKVSGKDNGRSIAFHFKLGKLLLTCWKFY